MRLRGGLGCQILEIMERTISRSGKTPEIHRAASQPAKSSPSGPDTICLLCPSHNLMKWNTKTSKCFFYRNIFTCQVLNTSSLYSDYLPCDLSIPYECLHFRLCCGFIPEKEVSWQSVMMSMGRHTSRYILLSSARNLVAPAFFGLILFFHYLFQYFKIWHSFLYIFWFLVRCIGSFNYFLIHVMSLTGGN